jgi:hypothetical protein
VRGRLRPLILVLAVAACTSAGPPAGTIPTVEDAQRHLAEIVRLAREGDFDGLCARGDLNCADSLEVAGRDAVPADPPAVLRTRIVPTTSSDGQQSLGGVVLVLCGIDGHGQHYDSEMLVFHDGNGLRAINPIYWGRSRIASSPETEDSLEPVNC